MYSVGCERGVHYYAMQLIDGPTLADVIAELRHRRQPRSRAAARRGWPRPERFRSLARKSRSATRPATALRHALSDGSARGRAGLSSTSTRSGAFFREIAGLGLHAAEALEHAHQNGVLHRDVKPSNLMVDGLGHLWVTDFGLARFQGEASLTADRRPAGHPART